MTHPPTQPPSDPGTGTGPGRTLLLSRTQPTNDPDPVTNPMPRPKPAWKSLLPMGPTTPRPGGDPDPVTNPQPKPKPAISYVPFVLLGLGGGLVLVALAAVGVLGMVGPR